MKIKLSILLLVFSFFVNAQIIINSPVNSTICDSDNNGFETINLTIYNAQFATNPTYSFTYFISLTDAQANINPITSAYIISSSKTFYVRVANVEDGFSIGILNVTFSNDCGLSVSETRSENVQFYPNPVIDFLEIKTEGSFIKAELFSILGTKLITSNSKKIDFSKLKSGIYIVKVYTDQSAQSFKIIKK